MPLPVSPTENYTVLHYTIMNSRAISHYFRTIKLKNHPLLGNVLSVLDCTGTVYLGTKNDVFREKCERI